MNDVLSTGPDCAFSASSLSLCFRTCRGEAAGRTFCAVDPAFVTVRDGVYVATSHLGLPPFVRCNLNIHLKSPQCNYLSTGVYRHSARRAFDAGKDNFADCRLQKVSGNNPRMEMTNRTGTDHLSHPTPVHHEGVETWILTSYGCTGRTED